MQKCRLYRKLSIGCNSEKRVQPGEKSTVDKSARPGKYRDRVLQEKTGMRYSEKKERVWAGSAQWCGVRSDTVVVVWSTFLRGTVVDRSHFTIRDRRERAGGRAVGTAPTCRCSTESRGRSQIKDQTTTA